MGSNLNNRQLNIYCYAGEIFYKSNGSNRSKTTNKQSKV